MNKPTRRNSWKEQQDKCLSRPCFFNTTYGLLFCKESHITLGSRNSESSDQRKKFFWQFYFSSSDEKFAIHFLCQNLDPDV
jgi:hypothetical protein